MVRPRVLQPAHDAGLDLALGSYVAPSLFPCQLVNVVARRGRSPRGWRGKQRKGTFVGTGNRSELRLRLALEVSADSIDMHD
jgi:hypothetical protein